MSKKFLLLGEFLTKQKNAVAHKHRKKINVGQIMVLRKCKHFLNYYTWPWNVCQVVPVNKSWCNVVGSNKKSAKLGKVVESSKESIFVRW